MNAGPPRSHQAAPDLAAEGALPRVQNALARVEAAVANPILAYGAILVLQLRVIWDIWRDRDLTFGDTSGYYLIASGWAHGLHDNVPWAPLYTVFLGTVSAVFSDPYTAVMLHRVAIILAATLLVLALMRSLLGPALGLLAAVWWAVLPPNFNVEYELHLFGLLPILVAVLVVSRSPGRGALGVALGILAGTALLLRSEVVLTAAIVAIAIVVYEVRERRTRSVPLSAYLRAYGVPLAVVCLLFGGAYWRSIVQGDAALTVYRQKHTLNMCQTYAYSYQQRYPSRFTGSPWTDCAPLMKQTFGQEYPSFLQMTIANPGAVARYAEWNARLLPSGLQVSLFGATSTGDSPGYFPVHNHRRYALVLSLALLALIAAGLAVMLREREQWRRALASRVWAVVLFGALAITTVVVALTERPRPEYLYGLTLGVMALAGVCASALLRRFRVTRLMAGIAAAATVALCLVLSSYYHRAPRPLHDAVSRLGVVRGPLQQPGSVLLTSRFELETCLYLGYDNKTYCSSPDWPALSAQIAAGKPVRDVLAEAKVTAIYADPSFWADPGLRPVLLEPRSYGFRQAAAGTASDGRWSVLIRVGKAPIPPVATPSGHAPAALSHLPGDLANPDLVHAGISTDGWMGKDASVVLAGGPAASIIVNALVLPPAGGERQHLRLIVNGRTVSSADVTAGELAFGVPVPATRSERRIELRWATDSQIGPDDPRRAAARLEFLGFVPPPVALRHFPGDLARGVSYSGIYDDGWLERRAFAVLAAGPARSLLLRAQVLPAPGGQRLEVLVNGHRLVSRTVPPGQLELELPVPASSTPRRVDLRWRAVVPLSSPDTRSAAALLQFLGLVPGPSH